MDLETCSQQWLDAKQAEREAVELRRDAENKLLSLIGIAENLDGTETVETDSGYKLKIVGRMNRKVDGDRVQEIAAEAGLTEHLPIFRSKKSVTLSQSQPVGIPPRLQALTSKKRKLEPATILRFDST